LTREEARTALVALARGIHEETQEAAVSRLLERLAGADEALKAAMLERGAEAVLQDLGAGR